MYVRKRLGLVVDRARRINEILDIKRPSLLRKIGYRYDVAVKTRVDPGIVRNQHTLYALHGLLRACLCVLNFNYELASRVLGPWG